MRPTRMRLSALSPTIRSVISARRAALDPSTFPPPTSSGSSPSTSTIPAATPAPTSKDIEVNGWVRSVRVHKNVAFVELNDGSTNECLQGVLKGKGKAEGITHGSSVKLKGKLEKSRGAGQDMELVISEAGVLGACDAEVYPIQKKFLPASVLRENAHLRFRTTQTAAIMRIRDALVREWHDWFEANEFVHIHTPILTGSDCEGAGEVFTLRDNHPHPHTHPSTATPTTSPPSDTPAPFFPHPTHLTVSSQLHLEAPTHALSRAYTLSPCFRAEPSLTSRHLSEFYMLEAEVAWVDNMDRLLDIVEQGVRESCSRIVNGTGRGARLSQDLHVVSQTLKEAALELEKQATADAPAVALSTPSDPLAHIRQVASTPFTRITYTSALSLLSSLHNASPSSLAPPPKWGEGISTDHEKFLAAHFAGPVFVTRYPKALKPFYMLPTPGELAEPGAGGETVECFDMIFPQLGEMAGGSMREHRLHKLEQAVVDAGMKLEDYEWYMDLRRYGTVPHGGWGMGWDRWVCWVTGVANVRDVVPFARWKGHCKY
ncbi:asparagine-tRNA ligase [Cryptococcus sp. DSM 104549]